MREHRVAENVDPSSQEARQTVDIITTTTNDAEQGTPLSGTEVLVSGQSATVHDEATQCVSDFALGVAL